MKIYLVDYATPKFYGSREMLHISAEKFGVDGIFSYGPDKLDEVFKKNNADILKHSKGAGYWIWKPYIIKDALKKIENNDVLIYSDVDQCFVQDARILAKECVELGIGLYISPRFTKVWTKRDCFIIMNCDSLEYHESFLGVGGISCWMKNDICEKILDEWLYYAQDPRISLRESPNVLGKPNLEGFIRHSTDQSILTILALKYGVKRLMPPGGSAAISAEFGVFKKLKPDVVLFYKDLGILREEGKIIARVGVFNMKQFYEIIQKPKLYFDGRQIYLKKPRVEMNLWDNPFYVKKE